MIITTLIEDKKHNHLLYEHGLSFSIKHNHQHYLLDAGASDKFMLNALTLKVPLHDIKACFLSHAHYDHSGGFNALIEQYPDTIIYAMKNALEPNYSISHGYFHEISIPEDVKKYKDHFIFIEKAIKVYDGVYVIPHNKPYTSIAKKCGMYKNEKEYDDFSHEMSVVFESHKGLIIFNSCSHAGLANIVEEVKEVLGDKPIYAYIGGLHLIGHSENVEICSFSEEEIKDLCTYIINNHISHIYTGHCSGTVGYAMLQKHLKDRLHPLYTGLTIEI